MKPNTIYGINRIDPAAISQFYDALKQPYVIRGALMPDAHLGYALPIGAVVATDDVVVPAWVGYDIGCGVAAVRLEGISPETIHHHAKEIFDEIYRQVPVGFNHHKDVQPQWPGLNLYPHTDWLHDTFRNGGLLQLGTLGSGNHFIEVAQHDKGVWIVVHSGSRNIGHKTATHYMQLAADGKAREGHYPLKASTGAGSQYITDMQFCMEFAQENRARILEAVRKSICIATGCKPWMNTQSMINRTHNHCLYEFNMWIHRKGATHANAGFMGVIPGNMADGSYIVRGKGNEEALWSSSHGAGRQYSRKKAKEELSLDRFHDLMQGVQAKVGQSTLDESPDAYKNFLYVMEDQENLVEIVAHLQPIINIKA